MDVRYGTRNVQGMYRAGSIMTRSGELSIYKRSDCKAVAPNQQENTHFSMEKGMRTMNWVQAFFVHKRMLSAGKGAEFVRDRMAYIILRGPWFNVIVLNVHAPNRE
jgi:hypothetical protein